MMLQAATFAFLLLAQQDPGPDWNVLAGRAEYEQAGGMFGGYLRKLGAGVQQQHEGSIESVKTAADLERFQTATREKLREAVGALPGRTPLNPKVTGVLERGDYAVEKLYYESRPGYYVTANAYVPRKARAPFPAVLANVGHWAPGKAFEDYQRLGMYLARRGILVLVWDMPGMGERVETWDPILRRPIVHPGTSEYFVTTEHGLAAGRDILTTGNLVSYLLWDAVRGLDYLESRSDVDARRLAASGVSGGGWLTELLAAFDPRVKVAIPVCYGGCIADDLFRSSMSPLLADALIAPRPLLMMEATGDGLGVIAQKRVRHEKIARLYGVAGAAERTRYMIAEGRHGIIGPMFPAAYEWLTRWLPGTPVVDVPEPRAELESEADLAATLTGQVRTSLGGQTPGSLNRAAFREIKRAPAAREAIAAKVGLTPKGEVKATVLARSEKGPYTVEKVVLDTEPGVYVPSLLLLPRNADGVPGVVWVGKSGAVERYVRPLAEAGCAVLAIDPRGMGETGPEPVNTYSNLAIGTEAGYFYTALRAGRSVLGMRVRDVLAAVEYLQGRPEVRKGVVVAGEGPGGLLALYAAALDDKIRGAAPVGTLTSYASVVESEVYSQPLSDFVQGALSVYDIPDLEALVAPRPLLIINPVDARQRPAGVRGPFVRRAGSAAEVVRMIRGM